MTAMERQMPPVKRAAVNGIEMAYYEAGPREGTPVVFCHGFPELAFSWRHQLKAFEAAGRWAIAPDQRGYGLTSRPEAVTDYDIEHLTGDLVGLLDHLGVEKAIFCGHDWGGIVVWQMALMHPDRVAGVIGLNTPFMPRSPFDPIAAMRMRFGPDMYIVWFQTPGDADKVLGADVEKTMRFFMRRADSLQRAAEPAEGESTFAFKDLLQQWDPSDQGGQLLTADDRERFRTRQPGDEHLGEPLAQPVELRRLRLVLEEHHRDGVAMFALVRQGGEDALRRVALLRAQDDEPGRGDHRGRDDRRRDDD